MSYEGYEQLICENGHEFSIDAYETMYSDNPYAEIKCPVCEGKVVWWNAVDLTNGSWDDDGERIDGYVELEIKTTAVHCECAACGDKHVKTAATVKIPEEGVGHKIKEKVHED